MNASYHRGIGITLAVIAAAALLAPLVPAPKPGRAAFDLKGSLQPLGPFHLTRQSGEATTDRDLAGRPWVASFVFTRCKASCPKITSTMKALQDRLKGTNVRLVSLSVDPEHDTPEVLTKYASTFGADPARWWFLTGAKDDVTRLVRDGFKLILAPVDPNDPDAAMMDIAHSDRLALVGPDNQILGLYNSQEKDELDRLVAAAKQADRAWAARFPAINASLNGLSTVLLLAGLVLIRTGRRRGHIVAMVSALVVSALFLGCYLTYHAMIGGGTPFTGQGLPRLIYFTVLISHVVLAAGVVPLIVITVVRAIRGQYDRHVAIARVTFPIWLYVSVTGVVVYWMLYQMTFTSPGA